MTTITFDSPQQFLECVRFALAQPWDKANPNQALMRLIDERRMEIASLTEDQWAGIGKEGHFAHVLRCKWQEALQAVPNDARKRLSKTTAVGLISMIGVNAFAYRCSDGYYAIGVNEGLFSVLHKLGKLTQAIIRPSCVTYCNRLPINKLTSQVASELRDEFVSHYARTQEHLPIQVMIDQEASISHMMMLDASEAFVVCHELGHILAGHFDENANWKPFHGLAMVDNFVDGKSHEHEFQADHHGYLLLRRWFFSHHAVLVSLLGKRADQYLLVAIVNFFDNMMLLGMAQSATHPSPKDRILSIAERVYGPAICDTIRSSYDDVGKLNAIPEYMEPIDQGDLSWL